MRGLKLHASIKFLHVFFPNGYISLNSHAAVLISLLPTLAPTVCNNILLMSCTQAFSQKGVRASLDCFGQNIGGLWTPKILKGKKITSVFNEEALTKASSTFLTSLTRASSTFFTFIAQLTI